MKQRPFAAWLQLFRPPNLVTVPGDPAAGFLLASVGGFDGSPLSLAAVIPSSLCLYAAGLLQNDCADLEEDQADRPDRPLPAGSVPIQVAARTWKALMALGVLFAATAGRGAGATAVLLAGAILFYNGGGKRVPGLSSVLMGVCRGLNVLLGAAAAGWHPGRIDPVAIAFVGTTLYVAAVTAIAANETRPVRLDLKRWYPCLAAVACMEAQAFQLDVVPRFFPVLAIGLIIWTFIIGVQLGRVDVAIVGRSIGRLLRGLILLQAAFCSMAAEPGVATAALLLCLWPVALFLGRRYYAT
jgi:hypothetical protein